jgi:excinuclease ABC subunit A
MAARSWRRARWTISSPPRQPDREYLNGTREIAVPAKRRKGNGKKLTVHNARGQQPAERHRRAIPLGTFTCVTGVSGGGKSSFTIDTLYAAAARTQRRARSSRARMTRSPGSNISTR